MILTTLFLQFVGFSLISFGGGYTVLPVLIDTFVTNERFWTMDQFGNLLSIAQITPGPISLNAATFIGYLKGGMTGALATSLGLVLPTLFLASLALLFLKKAQHAIWVQGALKGARLAALAMVGYTVFLFLGMSVFEGPISFKELGAALYHGTVSLSDAVHVNLIGGICFIGALFLILRFKWPLTPVLLLSATAGGLMGFVG